MIWTIAAIAVILWTVGWALYSIFKQLHNLLTRLVRVAEDFYSLSQRF
jgi:hypothetical protein